MITIRLEYPFHQDADNYRLPLPETIDIHGGLCLLNFIDAKEYFGYLDTMCDLIDEMEYNRLLTYSNGKSGELKFCKHYLSKLADADILTHCDSN